MEQHGPHAGPSSVFLDSTCYSDSGPGSMCPAKLQYSVSDVGGVRGRCCFSDSTSDNICGVSTAKTNSPTPTSCPTIQFSGATTWSCCQVPQVERLSANTVSTSDVSHTSAWQTTIQGSLQHPTQVQSTHENNSQHSGKHSVFTHLLERTQLRKSQVETHRALV